LQKVRRLFRARKAGHTGSLDPLASGMLPLCLGQATKVSAFLLDSNKVYRVCIDFGRQTATGDAEGAVVATGPSCVSEERLNTALAACRGTLSQVPPMYSALKHCGRRLYELARAGREVTRQPRLVKIHELVLETYDPRRPIVRVRCSKGTYVRSLVEEIARFAGTVGCVADLRRLAVDPFATTPMVTLEEVEAAAGGGDAGLDRLLIPADEAIKSLPAVRVGAAQALQLQCGREIMADETNELAGLVRLYGEGGRFLGVGESLGGSRVAPRRLMAGPLPARSTPVGL
jgi:tRNA pseudouridine55 synthase